VNTLQAQHVADLLRALAEALDAGVAGDVVIATDPIASMDRQRVVVSLTLDDRELLDATSPQGRGGQLWPIPTEPF
jgi:hypothetical protein